MLGPLGLEGGHGAGRARTFMAKISPVSRLRTWNTLPNAPCTAQAAGVHVHPLIGCANWLSGLGGGHRSGGGNWAASPPAPFGCGSAGHSPLLPYCRPPRTCPTMRSSSKSVGPSLRRPLVLASSARRQRGSAGTSEPAGWLEGHSLAAGSAPALAALPMLPPAATFSPAPPCGTLLAHTPPALAGVST